jgi:hypothetical protein
LEDGRLGNNVNISSLRDNTDDPGTFNWLSIFYEKLWIRNKVFYWDFLFE